MFRRSLWSDMWERMENMQREMDRLSTAALPFGEVAIYPPINIFDDGENFIARAELPGVDPNDLEVTAAGNTLTIKGKRIVSAAGENTAYHRRERQSGEFRRAFTLPEMVDSSKVTASSKFGVLEIVMPRAEQAKTKKIPVKVG